MENKIDNRLTEVISLIEGKITTYLNLCTSSSQKLFLLNYFHEIFDSATAPWFSYGLKEQPGPFFQYPNDEFEGKYYPSGLRWHEINNASIRKVLEESEFELHPQFNIIEETSGEHYIVDFAFFYPRTDRLGDKIKVAIDCNNVRKWTAKTLKENNEKDRFLQSKGWLIAKFTGAEIAKKDVYDLISEVEKLAMNKDYELFQQTEKHRINWQLN